MADEMNAEQDVRAWANSYVMEHRKRMAAESGFGRRPTKPSREEVKRAVAARFGEGSGRQGGALTWLRIMYWVAMILLML